jgi:hypothetical protein
VCSAENIPIHELNYCPALVPSEIVLEDPVPAVSEATVEDPAPAASNATVEAEQEPESESAPPADRKEAHYANGSSHLAHNQANPLPANDTPRGSMFDM